MESHRHPGGLRLGVLSQEADGKWYVIINGKEWGPYEEAGWPE